MNSKWRPPKCRNVKMNSFIHPFILRKLFAVFENYWDEIPYPSKHFNSMFIPNYKPIVMHFTLELIGVNHAFPFKSLGRINKTLKFFFLNKFSIIVEMPDRL